MSFRELSSLVNTDGALYTTLVTGQSGSEYNVEIQVMSDGGTENVRVAGGIDDGRINSRLLFLPATRPLSGGFIVAPDGCITVELG